MNPRCPDGGVRTSFASKPACYASAETRAIADSVLLHQRASAGGRRTRHDHPAGVDIRERRA